MKLVRIQKNLNNRKEWGCPLTKNRSNWCYQICVPRNGCGECGRVAPHNMLGRTRMAILRYNAAHAA
jgi:hypothetical protein